VNSFRPRGGAVKFLPAEGRACSCAGRSDRPLADGLKLRRPFLLHFFIAVRLLRRPEKFTSLTSPCWREPSTERGHRTVFTCHLNPARAGLVSRPEDWQWSSRGLSRRLDAAGGRGFSPAKMAPPFVCRSRAARCLRPQAARGTGRRNNQERLVTAGLKPRPSLLLARNPG
jgi:hypothetical protein